MTGESIGGGMVLAVVLLCACADQEVDGLEVETLAASIRPASTDGRDVTLAPGIRLDAVATGLRVPWAIDFAPDGRLFLTERPGRVRVVEDGWLREEPWAEFNVYAEDEQFRPESGLMGIAVAPDFARTGHVYVLGTFWRTARDRENGLVTRTARRLSRVVTGIDPSRWENRVYRLTDRAGRGVDPELVLDGLPASHYHAGGALAFGPDGMLYLTIGDVWQSPLAQDARSPVGKVLRYTPDGRIPADNPIPGSPVYALGLRNVQALAWDPATGDLFATEHGPTALAHEGGRWGHDELNVIRSAANYGWPTVVGRDEDPRFSSPLAEWDPGIAPAGLTFYAGGALPWTGDLIVAGLRGEQLTRVEIDPAPDDPNGWRVTAQHRLVAGLGRVRAVRAGPDGYIYFSTSNFDGRGSPRPGDDRLLRIRPLP